MVILVMVISLIVFGCAKVYRVWMKDQRKGLLDPPLDLLEGFFTPSKDDPNSQEETSTKQRNRYTKAQARQRFKKGKT